MLTPISNKPKITDKDIANGSIDRYFVKNISTKKIVEVDKEQYSMFKNYPYHEVISIPWVISGYDKDILDINGNIVLGAAKRNLQIIDYYESKMSGVRQLLRNPLEYFNGTIAKQSTIKETPVEEFYQEIIEPVTYTVIRDTIVDAITVLPTAIPDTREYRADFEISQFFTNSSTTLRPDAVSFDYKTSFTLGPTTIGGGAGGLLFKKVWKVRASDDNKIWYSVEDISGWSTEQLLFSYSGAPIIEIDAAFDQAGRLNIVAQRNTGTADAPQVWLYWFDPMLNNFTFQNLGDGRTPRISLDDWQTVANSDLLVFYIDDTANKIRYRVQRDKFNVIYNTPIISTQNTYLEKVGFASDYRYRVTYSQRNAITGTYELNQLATDRYPIFIVSESFTATGSFVSMSIRDLVRTASLYDIESFNASGSFVSMSIREIIVTSSLYDIESFNVSGSFVSMSVAQTVTTSSLYDIESFTVTGSLVSLEVIIP